MIIELRGLGFVNKGASLMLYAILERVKREIPDALFAMECTAVAPKNKLLELGIYEKFNIRKKGLEFAFIGDYLPKSYKKKHNIVSESEIDIVLDGSGFAFGDKWGAVYAGNVIANHIKKWKLQNKKVILLPQAFGPFTKEDLKAKMSDVVKHADLIFARDQISHDHIRSLSDSASNIELKPDFTNLIKGRLPAYFDSKIHEVAIIPNSQMIKHSDEATSKMYPDFLLKVIESVQKSGANPYFLIHAGQTDMRIANLVNSRLPTKIPILDDENPLIIKGLIGASKAVITSRFHGLVSALSQAVPCYATSWSHKYEMLLGDYDYSEGILSVNSTDDVLNEKIAKILEPESNSEVRNSLEHKALSQKKMSEEMWRKVIEAIK